MQQYKNEMDNLHWTDEGKANLLRRIKTNAEHVKIPKRRFAIGKCIAIVATISLISVTVYATDIIETVGDIFAPIFGGMPVQTEIIESIGRPIGASDTSNGITITADAIIGDSNNVCVVYSISNEDGTPFALPQGIEPEALFFSAANDDNPSFEIPIGVSKITDDPRPMFFSTRNSGIQWLNGSGPMSGTRAIQDADQTDGMIQIIEKVSLDSLLIGENVTAKFSNISYYDTNGEDIITLSDGSWTIKYELNFEDSSIDIPVSEEFKKNGLTYRVDSVKISPIAIQAYYTVNSVIIDPLNDKDDKKRSEFLDVDIIITKVDGTIIDLTKYCNGWLRTKDDATVACKGTFFDEIISLNDIASVTIGDVSIDINV